MPMRRNIEVSVIPSVNGVLGHKHHDETCAVEAVESECVHPETENETCELVDYVCCVWQEHSQATCS